MTLKAISECPELLSTMLRASGSVLDIWVIVGSSSCLFFNSVFKASYLSFRALASVKYSLKAFVLALFLSASSVLSNSFKYC